MTDASLDATIELLKTQLLLRPNDPHKRFQLGNILRKGGRLDEAIQAFTRAVTAKPDFAEAHYQLGLIYREKSDPTTALAYFNQAAAHDPKNLEALRNRAEMCAALERDEDALETWEQVLALEPNDPTAPREAGIRRYRRADYERAIPLLRRASDLEPERIELLALLGLSSFRAQDLPGARNALSDFLRKGGDSPMARKCLAEALAGTGDLIRATDVARDGIEKFPDDVPLWHTFGRLLAERGQLEAAVAALERASIESTPELHATFGHVLLRLGRHADAVTQLREAGRLGGLRVPDVVALGEAYLGSGELVPAVDELERAVRLDGANAKAAVLLGHAYLGVGRERDALSMLRRAEQLGDSNEALLLVIAELQEKLNLNDEALATFGRVLSSNATSVPALFGVGRRVLALGHPDDAIDPLKEAVRLAPEHADAQIALGRALVTVGRHVEASDALKRYVELRPHDLTARMELARSLRAVGRADDAIPVLEAATDLAPANGTAFRELGAVYAEAKQLEPAIDAYERAVQIAPQDGIALEQLARQLFRSQYYDRALQTATRALDTRPNDPVIHRLRGQIHVEKGEDHKARGELERAYFLDPHNRELAKEVGLVLARLGNADKALPHLASAWGDGDASAEVATALAGAYRELGRTDEAISTLESARAAHPEDAEMLLQLGFLYEQRNDLDRAVVTYREVTRLRGDLPEALDRAARVYLKLDMPDEAVQALDQLLRARPTDAGAWFELGNAYAKLENEGEAIAAYTRASELRPTHLATWMSLARAHVRRGDLPLAVDAYREGLKLEPGAREETLELAAILERLGRSAERTLLLQSLTQQRSDPEVLLELARAKAEIGRVSEAVKLFDDALEGDSSKLDPNAVIRTWNLVGHAYSKLDSSRKVVSLFERLAVAERTSPKVVVTIAHALRDLGRAKSALAAIKRVATDPAPEGAYRLLAELHGEAGKHDEAADAWELVVRDEPKAVDARWTLATTYVALRRRSEALAMLRTVVQLEPNHADAWSELAQVLEQQGDNYGQIEALTELVRLRNNAAAYRRLAEAYGAAGRHEEAIDALRSAIRLEPKEADHKKALGLAYAKVDDEARAISAIEDALKLDPGLHELRAIAAKMLRAKGDHGGALAHLSALTIASAHTPETWRMLAETLVAMQKIPEAIDAVRRAAEAAPKDAEIKRLRGTLAMQAKLWDEAAAAYEAWLLDDPADVEALAALATCYAKLQRPEQGLRTVRAWVKAAPIRHEPHLELGLLLLARGDHRAALDAFDRACEIRPDLPTAFMGIAECWGALDNLPKRAEALETYVKLVGTSPQAHAMLGEAYDKIGRTDDAIASYTRAVEQDGRLFETVRRLAELHVRRGDYVAAVSYMRTLVEKTPSAEGYIDLAIAERRTKRYGEALRSIEHALDLAPNNVEAQRLKAALWADRGEHDPAKALLEEIIRHNPEDLEARYEVAKVYESLQEYPPARAHLRAVTSKNPRHAPAQLLLARVLEAIDNPKAAAECYAEAAEVRGLTAEQLLSWAGCLMAIEDHARAEVVLKSAIDLDPAFTRAHLALGMMYYKTTRPAAAVDAFLRAIEISPEDAELRAALGAAQSKAGRPREAAEAYAKAIELGRQTPQMHFQLGVALSKAGNPSAARTHVGILESLAARDLAERLRAMLEG